MAQKAGDEPQRRGPKPSHQILSSSIDELRQQKKKQLLENHELDKIMRITIASCGCGEPRFVARIENSGSSSGGTRRRRRDPD
jgi:hypothetical protein